MAAIADELKRVAEKLALPKTKGAERLELLRRQASLGDLRDAIADRARRAVGDDTRRH